MKPIVLLAAVPAFICMSATVLDGGTTTLKTGTYGVCGCTEDAPGPAHVALTISNDGSFRYVDGSAPEINGEWRRDGRKLVLRSATATGAVEHTWTMDKDAPCLRTRYGLKFVRLCHLKKCD